MSADLPVSVWQGSFTLLGVELRCHTLSNGQRIIEPDSMDAFLTAFADPYTPFDEAELHRFAKWKAGDAMPDPEELDIQDDPTELEDTDET
jgi:hypothetical protein